jgi:hypothetical protein
LTPRAIAGIVLGIVAGLCLVTAAAFYLLLRRRQGRQDHNAQTSAAVVGDEEAVPELATARDEGVVLELPAAGDREAVLELQGSPKLNAGVTIAELPPSPTSAQQQRGIYEFELEPAGHTENMDGAGGPSDEELQRVSELPELVVHRQRPGELPNPSEAASLEVVSSITLVEGLRLDPTIHPESPADAEQDLVQRLEYLQERRQRLLELEQINVEQESVRQRLSQLRHRPPERHELG